MNRPIRPPPTGVRRASGSAARSFDQQLQDVGVSDSARQVLSGNRHAIPVRGIVPVDVMGDMLNTHIDPFVHIPLDEDGSVNEAAYTFQVIGGALSLLSIIPDLIDHGIAILLAPFAQMCELPAACLMDLHVGMPHGHSHPPSLIPPAPPVPLPSLGCLTLSGAVTVTIGGFPAARAGDVGLAPTCGSFAPMFMVVTGSSSVFIGGGRAARMGDLTIHCNPVLAAILKFSSVMTAIGAVGGLAGAGAAAAGGNAIGAAAAALQATADLAAEAAKATIGMDPGIPPMVMGAITTGSTSVMIGGLPVPPAEIVLGMLKGELDIDSGNPRRNRHHDDADSDPHNPRRARRVACEC